jgi:hypothetical protein
MSNRIALPMVALADQAAALEPSLKSVLHRLCLDADQHSRGFSDLTTAQLSLWTGFSKRAVTRALGLLAAGGHLSRSGDPGQALITTLHPKAMLPKHAAGRRPKISNAKRKRIMERDAYRCRHCNGHIDLSVDHIVPWAAGGGNDDDNLQVLCVPCNRKKGAALK